MQHKGNLKIRKVPPRLSHLNHFTQSTWVNRSLKMFCFLKRISLKIVLLSFITTHQIPYKIKDLREFGLKIRTVNYRKKGAMKKQRTSWINIHKQELEWNLRSSVRKNKLIRVRTLKREHSLENVLKVSSLSQALILLKTNLQKMKKLLRVTTILIHLVESLKSLI